MPRRPRIYLPGVPIHMVQRGHNREACFFTDEDFLVYLEWLGEALKKTGCALHAYVLMTNHVHLLLTPPTVQSVSQLVISLGRRYVQYINICVLRSSHSTNRWTPFFPADLMAGCHASEDVVTGGS